jgi:ribosomal protein L23
MSNFSQERLMQVLLAPQISEKATFIADRNNQVVFKVASDATKPEIKAAVELLFSKGENKIEVLVGSGAECQGQGQALRPWFRPSQRLEEGVRVHQAGPGHPVC